MNKKKIIILVIAVIFIFILIYIPHLVNPFPIHVDEWHHITQALKLKNGDYLMGWKGVEIGFHFFLMILSFFIDLVLYYKYLPAIWAVISALTLFYVVYNKTHKNFFIAFFSMIFFASIKSNVNILGLWFFVPLTFSIPFIFLYIYFFTEGIKNQNKKQIVISLLIMLFLIPIHSISVLFAIPFLIIYSLFYYFYLKKEWKFFLLFLLVPLIGISFFSVISNISIFKSFLILIDGLQFEHGWGVLELNNSSFEVYSLIGYILAVMGIFSILTSKKKIKQYLIYLLWPVIVFLYIIIFKVTGISYLSPYQRNIYYLAISLPFLSAFGLYYLIRMVRRRISKMNFSKEDKIFLKKIIFILIMILVIFVTFRAYFNLPKSTLLYRVIDGDDYNAIKFLSQFPEAKVLARHTISPAIYPISQQEIVASIFHYAKYREDSEKFFLGNTTCFEKQELIEKHEVDYVLVGNRTNCNWTEIYSDGDYIYEVGK